MPIAKMSNRPTRGNQVAMRPHPPQRTFDPTMRRPMGPRGSSGPPSRPFGPPRPRGYPEPRGMRPPFLPVQHFYGPPPNTRPPPYLMRQQQQQQPPPPPYELQSGSFPMQQMNRLILQQPGGQGPPVQSWVPENQLKQHGAGPDLGQDKGPSNSSAVQLLETQPGQNSTPPPQSATGQCSAEDGDDVVSLFGGSDFGDNENANGNANNGKSDSGDKQQQQQQSNNATAKRLLENPTDASRAPVLNSTLDSGRQPDLRSQLGPSRASRGSCSSGGTGVISGGGLLPRPTAQSPAGQPRVLLQKPPPQQVQQSFDTPPHKRARTLLSDGPPNIGAVFNQRGGVRGGRGSLGVNRGGRPGGGGNTGDAGLSRTLLPTPHDDQDFSQQETDDFYNGPDGDSDGIEGSAGTDSAGRYLLLPPSASAASTSKPPQVGLLQAPEQLASSSFLPAPAGSGASGRASLLGGPPGRSQVLLPPPRQVEASADTIRVSLLTSQQAMILPTSSVMSSAVSSTAIAAYPAQQLPVGSAGGPFGVIGDGLLGRQPRMLHPHQQVPTVKTEAEMRAELTEAFKSQHFEQGYELLKVARATYPHEFTDLVVYEVVEYCASKKEALEVCVLTARLISEPNVKLLELLADLAEKNPGQLRPLTDELWLVFNNVLTLQPDATAMMAFIRCFSSLKSWTKVWGAVDRFAPMQIIPIEGFIFCLEALVNGNASEFVNLGISLLSNMDPQNLQQVGLELVERLWLRCALDGSSENVLRIEHIRAIFHLTPLQQSNFLNRIRVKVTELVMGNDFDTLCKFFSSVSNQEVLSEFVIDAFHVAEDPQAKFELLSKAIAEKFRSRNPTMEAFISQTAVRLLKKSADRMQWADALKLLRSLRGLNINLFKAVSLTQPDMSESAIANLAFQIYMRSQCYSIAASMLSADTSPIGLALPVAGEHASSRFQLLHELCTACIAEGTLADAAAALNAMMQHPVSRSSELNKVYNEFLAACCEASSEDLKVGVEIIPKAHTASLVISATVLRMLLCASFKHGMKAHAKEYLMLGTKVGIYPVISVSCPGPKTVQLQSDLAKDEIQVILSNLFVKLKKYLMESLQSRELDVIQECTIKLTALGVGNRDAKFIEVHKIQSSEQAVLQRASEILQTPNNFQSVVSTRFLSENGVSVLKLDGTMVYQCVYYVDEDV